MRAWGWLFGPSGAAGKANTTFVSASSESTSCAEESPDQGICEPCTPAAIVSRLELYGHLQHHPALNDKAQLTFSGHMYAVYHEADYEAILMGQRSCAVTGPPPAIGIASGSIRLLDNSIVRITDCVVVQRGGTLRLLLWDGRSRALFEPRLKNAPDDDTELESLVMLPS